MSSQLIVLIASIVFGAGEVSHAEEVSKPDDGNSTQAQPVAVDLNAVILNTPPEKAPEQQKAEVPPQGVVASSPNTVELERKIARLETEVSRLGAVSRRQSTLMEQQETKIRELTIGLLETTRLLKRIADHLEGSPQSNPGNTNTFIVPSAACEPNPPIPESSGEQSVTSPSPPNV